MVSPKSSSEPTWSRSERLWGTSYFPLNLLTGMPVKGAMDPTCYMCDAPGITEEHSPPKGLFPKLKDTADRRDLRKNLITVPSCEAHNTEKSAEDEYFVFVLNGSILANAVGERQAATKQKRALDQAPGKLKKFVPSWEPVTFKDESGGDYPSALATLDKDRFESVVDKMGRALYFHHFKEKWTAKMVSRSSLLLYTGGKDSESANQQLALIDWTAAQLFAGAESFGNNPEVFFYNARTEPSGSRAIRAMFYGDIQIVFLYSLKDV